MKLQQSIAADEEVILIGAGHWITLLKPFFLLLGGWGLFLFLFFIADLTRSISLISAMVLMIGDFLMLILIHHFAFIFVLQWFISNLVLTTKQLIELRFLPFVEDDVNFIEISQIHEIEKKKHGIFKNILNYGDVVIDFLGKAFSIEFHYVDHPGKFVNLVEGIKFKRPLQNIDLKGLAVTYSEKYQFLRSRKG